MTPEEKAKELVDKFTEAAKNEIFKGWVYYHKKCALIAVEEVLAIFEGLHKPEYVSFDIYEPKKYHMDDTTDFNGYTMSEYYEAVKEEIKKQ